MDHRKLDSERQFSPVLTTSEVLKLPQRPPENLCLVLHHTRTPCQGRMFLGASTIGTELSGYSNVPQIRCSFARRVMSKPIPLLIIQRAREVISDDQRWCRGSYARGKAGASVSVHHPDARRFCAMGALLLAASELCGTDTTAAGNLTNEAAKLL